MKYVVSLLVALAVVFSGALLACKSEEPEIISVIPNEGMPGDVVNIIGKNFKKGDEIFFNTTKARIVSAGKNQLIIRIPSPSGNSEGIANITVVRNGENKFVSMEAFLFTKLSIKNIHPASGPKNTIVTIHGTGFRYHEFEDADTKFLFCGVPAEVVCAGDRNTIKVVTPAFKCKPGPVDVTALNPGPDGGETATLAGGFTFTE